MSTPPGRRSGPGRRPAGRLAGLAAEFGIELPPFSGPLEAFRPGGEPGEEEPIYLGGDLHAAHPGEDGAWSGPRDSSLDAATVRVEDSAQESLEVRAVMGIWCLALPEEILCSSPYFMAWDSEGRLRAWLILPPIRSMVGIGPLWLPTIRPR